MTEEYAPLPTDLAEAHAMLLAERAARLQAETAAQAARTEALQALAEKSEIDAYIAHLKLQIEMLRRELYGKGSERKQRLLEQMELQLEDLETDAAEDKQTVEQIAQKTEGTEPAKKKSPSRKPFPAHLPRERIVIPAPKSCPCCGSDKLSKLGEDITETLEVIPRKWKVLQTVREKFSCRKCEKISQPPAPFHVIPRGFAGPKLLSMILFEKYGQHQPLNRQSERYAREGIDLSVSTLCDLVGASATALQPLHDLIRAHVLSADRLHGDDTTVPIMARSKTRTGRIWVYVRDDAPFAGGDPPASLFYASRDRCGDHPREHLKNFTGLLQADAFSGYNELYLPDRKPAPVTPAFCWAHGRRKFFELADIAGNVRRGKKATPISPIALEAVKRIDAIFDIERDINGKSAGERLAVRQEKVAPLVCDLKEWFETEKKKLSRHNPVTKAISYVLKRWEGFTGFLNDGRICLTNNAAERALRGIAMGRKSWLFAGSDRGADRAAFMYTLISTAKLNNVDPQAWLSDVLERIGDTPQNRLHDLLPWNWTKSETV